MELKRQSGIKIGELELNGFVYIPPMAGVTDLAYRILCREYDPGVLLSTEMLSSRSLTYAHSKGSHHEHSKRLDIPENDALTGVQLFGHEPQVMAEAAIIATEAGAKFIDINMGCPVAKIVNGRDGAALMKEPDLALSIVEAVILATPLPVTVKTRLGWCENSCNAPDLARRFEDAGIKGLTIHGRTRQQKYSGHANWHEIARVVEAISIPVFANGDIKTVDDAVECLRLTKAQGLAIARATMGKPWLSKQVNHFIKTGEKLAEPSNTEKLDLALRHSSLLIQIKGEYIGIKESRRHVCNYISGMHNASALRSKIVLANSYEEIEAAVEEFKEFLNLANNP
jgi:tRNA-dihydrouridine synthase B